MASRKEKRQEYKDSVYRDLNLCIQHHILRRDSPELKEAVSKTAAFQSRRIGETYSDLAARPRYELAIDYFQHDMYGAKDYSRRDSDVKKVYPIVERVMPNRLFYILTFIMELNALTMQLDEAQATQLVEMGAIDDITPEHYAEAYRRSDNYEDRKRQIELVLKVGEELDKLSGKSYLGGVLKISDKPAHALGLGDLHDFLGRGYKAFIAMDGAGEFIRVIREREMKILDAIFNGEPEPFRI
ncbi:MAG: FFLEELY motif protein [Pseudomonadota bacterium]